ncbi:MAG: S26 family signal peptidase [Hyphomicrobiaceae bacterium]|nr:S26 family signal peptidase [Hyphomicrobiaceae bacterium]
MTAIGTAALTASTFEQEPRFVWNASPSVPVGFYSIAGGEFEIGSLVAVRLPPQIAAQAHVRRYLDHHALLLKPVRAAKGSRVCRSGPIVSVDSRVVVLARSHDGAGRPLPVWRGCFTLAYGDLFLLSNVPESFDGRYFGVLPPDVVVGQAIPLWTWRP